VSSATGEGITRVIGRPNQPGDPGVLIIRILSGPLKGNEAIILGHEPFLIGTDFSVTLRLPDPSVSRRHIELVNRGGYVNATDLDSTNGSYFEGNRFKSLDLGSGSVFRLGETELQIVAPEKNDPIPPSEETNFGPLLGKSRKMREVFAVLERAARTDATVLITGETGTGKSLIAHALHACGPRKGKTYVPLNCAALEGDALERALYGPLDDPSMRPAVEEANGGTLCLENVEALSPALQARIISDLSTDDDVESTQSLRNIRVISISSQISSVDSSVEGMRDDLFFRLSGLHLSIPPLRDRGEDILMLFNRFATRFAEDYGCAAPDVSADDAARLIQARWPGNIRQLINVAERAVLKSRRGEKGLADLVPTDDAPITITGSVSEKPLKEQVEAFEKMLIDTALRRNRGAVSAVMDQLNLPRRTLNEKMAKYGLVRAEYL